MYDPEADPEEVKEEYGIELKDSPNGSVKYNAIVLAVGHTAFKDLSIDDLKNGKSVIYDIKGFFDKDKVDARL